MAAPAIARVHTTCAVLMLLGGLAHMAATLFFPERSGLEAIFLFGFGMGLCYLGLLNLALPHAPAAPGRLRIALHLANLAMLAFSVVLTVHAPRAPQLYVLIATTLALTLTAAVRRNDAGDGAAGRG